MKRTTMMDVARLAGVGKVTVSYVLNGRSRDARISSDTERRVREAAESLRYRPNALARMLVAQRTSTIGVVFQYAELFASGSGFINEAMRGVCAASVEEGIDLMLHTKPVANPDMEADVLSDGRVDGVLILRDRGDRTTEALVARHFPTVRFFSRASEPESAWVDADNFQGARLAVEHLLALGHIRIAMMKGSPGSGPSSERVAGYLAAMGDAGIEVSPELLIRCGTSAEVRDRLPDVLRQPNRPTAIFAWSDDVALTCLEVARDLGLSVPRDLSVVGFDSLDASSRSVPPLTSVRQPVYEMARTATQLLTSILRNDEIPHRQIVFPLVLDVRGSTAPAILNHKEVHP